MAWEQLEINTSAHESDDLRVSMQQSLQDFKNKEFGEVILPDPVVTVEKNQLGGWTITIDFGKDIGIHNDYVTVLSGQQYHDVMESASYVDPDHKIVYLPPIDPFVNSVYIGKIQTAIQKALSGISDIKDLDSNCLMEVVSFLHTEWVVSDPNQIISKGTRGIWWYVFYRGLYDLDALWQKRSKLIAWITKQSLRNITVGAVVYNKLEAVTTNKVVVTIMKNIPGVEVVAERNKTLPQSIQLLDWKDLLTEYKLPEFKFKPIEYYDLYSWFFYYQNALYLSDDKRFEIVRDHQLQDKAWNRVELDITKKFWVKGGKNNGNIYTGNVTTTSTPSTQKTGSNGDTSTTISYGEERHIGEKWEVLTRQLKLTYYRMVNWKKETVEEDEVVDALPVWQYKGTSDQITAMYGSHLTFDPADVVLDETSSQSIQKSLTVLLKHLHKNPDDHITIFSSASYTGERVTDNPVLVKHFDTVLRQRTIVQGERIKQALIKLKPEYANRIHVVWLWEDGAYDAQWKPLWIRTWVLTGNHPDPHEKENIPLMLPGWNVAINEVPSLPKTAYPIVKNQEEQKNEMEKLMGEWLIGFLTKIQAFDGVLNLEERGKVLVGATKFVSICTALITQIYNNAWSKVKALNNIHTTASFLEWISDERSRIAVYMIMKFYQKHVLYNSDDDKKFGTTFVGLSGFWPDAVVNEETKVDNRVQMDCDIMTILAHDILSKVAIKHTMLIQYENGVANHANGKVDKTIIERTNAANFWASDGEWQFVEKKTPLAIASAFMNTYEVKNISEIEDIRREWMRFCMDPDNAYNLSVAIINYSRWLQTRMTENKDGTVTTQDVEILSELYWFLEAMNDYYLKAWWDKLSNYKIVLRESLEAIHAFYKYYTIQTDTAKIPALRSKYKTLWIPLGISIEE